jgi:tetratricopeptide (TPR) repeat protein
MKALIFVSALSLAQPAPHEHEAHSDRIGKVAFQTSCSPAGQSSFLQGVAWLHSFEYEQAEGSFSQAAAADPSCAIAHWGVAMSLYHPLWAPPTPAELEKARAAVARALNTPAKTQREKDYVDAIASFYRDSDRLDHKTRVLSYNVAMKALHERYPSDREAAVFYALSQTAAGTLDADPTFAREKDAAAILSAVLEAEPDHPGVAHYLIHSFDYPPLAALAVPAARRYAGLAPDSAHAQHMPSHIFTRLGMWDESIASNLKSEAAARALMRRKSFLGGSREELHAMDYLAYAYLQTGQDNKAREVLAKLNGMRAVDEPIFSVAYAVTAIPARLVLERRQWKEAAILELPDHVAKLVPLETFPWAAAHIHFARAVGAGRSGDPASAKLEIAKLTEIEQKLQVPPGSYDWKTQVGINRQIAAAWLARAEGRNDDALRMMQGAAKLDDALEKHPVTPGAILPAREQLGDLLLDLERPAEALVQFEASLKRAPLRLNGLFGAARAGSLAGNQPKARDYYVRLVRLTKKGDAYRTEIQEARAAVERNSAH